MKKLKLVGILAAVVLIGSVISIPRHRLGS